MFKSSTIFKLFSIFSFVIFGIVFLKLFYLQIIQGDKYEKMVEVQSDPRLSVFTDRGYIYDKEGRLLARNKSAGSLYAYRRNIPNKYDFFKALEENGIKISQKTKKALKETDSFTWISRQIDLEKAEKLSEKIPGLEYFVEDARFYEHSGIDPWGIARAMVSNIKAGRMVEGGSTLTQQLVKVIYLSPERKLKRKIKEVIIAYRLDKELSKEKILELYLNQVNFGRGAYGIQAAAINYFGKKDVKDLTIAEAAMIAGIPKGPSIYAPHLNMKRAVARRNHVLKRMLEVEYITQEEYEKSVNETVKLAESIPLRLRYAGYFMDFIHKYIEEDLKIEDAQNKGIKVFTTLNLDYQIAAEEALIKNLMSIAKREGYTGPLGKILVEDETDVEQAEDASAAVGALLDSLFG